MIPGEVIVPIEQQMCSKPWLDKQIAPHFKNKGYSTYTTGESGDTTNIDSVFRVPSEVEVWWDEQVAEIKPAEPRYLVDHNN